MADRQEARVERRHEASYAILMVDRLPHRLFDDMDSAREYVENHDRLDYENASIYWPVREQGWDDAE